MLVNRLVRIGYLDAQFIEDFYRVISDRMDFSHLESMPLGEINANVLIYEIFDCINRKVFSNIIDKLKNNEIGKITKKLKKATDL